jgi:uncharacterized SAM-binding protein YcdF (DUF218 family)
MLAAKKFITAWLLPPGCIIAVMLLLALRHLHKRRWRAALATAFCASLLWACATAPVANRFMAGLERDVSLPARPEGDVIILLGGGLIEGVPDLSGSGTPSHDMQARLVTAVRLQRTLRLPVIISGGAVHEYRTAEAPVVRRFLLDLGVPKDQVIIEDKSRDTLENARYTAKICADRGFRHPLLVTSAYHMRRSVKAFASQGMNVLPIPAQFQVGPHSGYSWAHYLPQAGSMAQTATALREYIGLLYYRLTL